MANIVNLDDLKAAPSDGPKGQDMYAGGEKSGIAMEMPPDRLVETTAENRPTGHITVYRNGLLCNKKFYPRDDPNTAKYLEDLREGFAPMELFQDAIGTDTKEVAVSLEQRVFEDYEGEGATPVQGSPPKMKLFEGQGNSLGGQSVQSVVVKETSGQTVNVDDNKDKTTVKVRLVNGQVRSQQFNQDATVEELFVWAENESGVSNFDLFSGFPPKPMSRDVRSLKAAGALNEMFTMRNK